MLAAAVRTVCKNRSCRRGQNFKILAARVQTGPGAAVLSTQVQSERRGQEAIDQLKHGPLAGHSKPPVPNKIVEAKVNPSGTGLVVVFKDGSSHEFLHVWLRDSCFCPSCFNDSVQLRHSNSWLPDLDIQPRSFEVTSEGNLELEWPPDQHRTEFTASWLLECRTQMLRGLSTVPKVTGHRAPVTLWNKMEDLPRAEYDDFMNTPAGLRHWMTLFHKYGFVILEGVPEAATVSVAKRISFIRETCFGYTSDVLVGPETGKHPGYSGDAFQLHTDLTYMERSPGTLNLHCIQSVDPETFGEDAGGASILADGMEAAQWVRRHRPEAFRVLTEVQIPYAYKMPSTGFLYTSCWPVVTLDALGQLHEIHFSQFARKTLKIDPKLIPPVYEALKVFADRLQETKVTFYLRPGDLVSVNNRRVLHGRTAFDPQKGTRHLRSFYMDLDEVYAMHDIVMHKEI